MEKKKTVAVRIGSMTYHLSAKENSQYITEIAEEADLLIKQIRSDNPGLNSVHISVLALINALDQKHKQKISDSKLRENISACQSRCDSLNAECLTLRETCWELKKELLYHKNLCDVYQERIDELSQISNQDKINFKSNQQSELKPLDKLQTSFMEVDNSSHT